MQTWQFQISDNLHQVEPASFCRLNWKNRRSATRRPACYNW